MWYQVLSFNPTRLEEDDDVDECFENWQSRMKLLLMKKILIHQTTSLNEETAKDAKNANRYTIGCDMWSAYETILTHDQSRRANQTECLDEIE
jgi:hypothetical protein